MYSLLLFLLLSPNILSTEYLDSKYQGKQQQKQRYWSALERSKSDLLIGYYDNRVDWMCGGGVWVGREFSIMFTQILVYVKGGVAA